jgi:hypothetical protein
VAGLVALAPGNLPRLDSVFHQRSVLVFALLLSSAVAAGLGVFTAVRSTSGDPREALGEGGRGQAGSQSSQRTGRVIVAAQIAITLVLVVGGDCSGAVMIKVLQVDPGFRVGPYRSNCDDGGFASMGGRPQSQGSSGIFFANLNDRLRQIRGVRGVGATSGLPLVGGGLPTECF